MMWVMMTFDWYSLSDCPDYRTAEILSRCARGLTEKQWNYICTFGELYTYYQ